MSNSQDKKVYTQYPKDTNQYHRRPVTSDEEKDGDYAPYAEVEAQSVFEHCWIFSVGRGHTKLRDIQS